QFILVKREPWVSTDNTVYPCNTRISLDALHIGIELADIIGRRDGTLRLYSHKNRRCLAIIEPLGKQIECCTRWHIRRKNGGVGSRKAHAQEGQSERNGQTRERHCAACRRYGNIHSIVNTVPLSEFFAEAAHQKQ